MYEERELDNMRPLQGRLAILSNQLELALSRLGTLVAAAAKVEEEVHLWEAADEWNEENLGGLLDFVPSRFPDSHEPQEPPAPTGKGVGHDHDQG